MRIVSFNPSSVIREAIEDPDFQAVDNRLRSKKRVSSVSNNATRVYAIELDNGAMIKIQVGVDDAERFAADIQSQMATNPDVEVGSLIYELTKYYDIYDIEWRGMFDDELPVSEDLEDSIGDGAEAVMEDEFDLAEDEDVPADPEADEADEGEEDVDDSENAEFNDDIDLTDIPPDGDEEEEATSDLADDTDIKDLLQTIVGQLKQDAEARKAEAEARKAEAESDKAKAVAQAMELKMRQEQQIAAMEQWEDEEKAKAKRSKLHDRMARYKLAQAQGLADSRTYGGITLTESQINSLTRVCETASVSGPMRRLIRDIIRAARENPLKSDEQFNAFVEQIKNFSTNMPAIRSQQNIELANVRRTGDQNKMRLKARENQLELATDRRIANIRAQEEKALNRLRAQIGESLSRFAASTGSEMLVEAVRQFRRKGTTLNVVYRCKSGPKTGQLVTDMTACGQIKNRKRIRHGRRVSKSRKSVRVRKTRVAKKRAISKFVTALNRSLAGGRS